MMTVSSRRFAAPPTDESLGREETDIRIRTATWFMVRSRDGETWTTEPELIYAHPFGGSQDPCLLRLKRRNTCFAQATAGRIINQDGIA
ncbi:MAG: hypothetical protein ACOX2D_00010 [Fermentimonas sp.]